MSARLEGAEAFRKAQEAYFQDSVDTNAKTEAEVVRQGFAFEEHPGVERMVARVKPTTVYEAQRPRRRPRKVQ